MILEQTLPDHALRGVILVTLSLLWVILLVRMNGLRSFSKMTNFDFVATVATGSLLAGAAQATSWTGFLQSNTAILGIFAAQFLLAYARRRSDGFETLIQNTPVLLMHNGEIIEPALVRTRVTRDDLIAKLREANVLDLSKVRAAVLETTGDVSILHGDNLDEALLTGVSGSA